MNYKEVIRLAQENGFIFPSAEIYAGAPAGFWEYGPNGVALKERFTALWRRELVRGLGMVEIDGSQILPKVVFDASGHLESLVDPVSRCSKCNATHRIDKILSDKLGKVVPERLKTEEFDELVRQHNIRCPRCGGELGKTERFNMMFRLSLGGSGEEAYLRPETCQSIFLDFRRLFTTMRLKLPVGIAQLGKSFRNEIAPRQSLIRLREFTQAEIEIFFNPAKAHSYQPFTEVKEWALPFTDGGENIQEIACGEAVKKGLIVNEFIAYYLAKLHQFYIKTGLQNENLRFRTLSEEDRAFYSSVAYDFEVRTSLGWIELVACNYRSDYDLRSHASKSTVDLSVMDDGERVTPHVFELSMGVDRSLYCILENLWVMDSGRLVLHLPAYLAPVKAGFLPLVSKDRLPEIAYSWFSSFRKDFNVSYDESGSIGRRYRRLDEIGVPFAFTADSQSLEDGKLTVRDRDKMTQRRVSLDEARRILEDSDRVPE